MYIGTPSGCLGLRVCTSPPFGRLGLRGAAARRSATWPLGPFGLGATSHTRPRYVQDPQSAQDIGNTFASRHW
jgi:hypothetical protein